MHTPLESSRQLIQGTCGKGTCPSDNSDPTHTGQHEPAIQIFGARPHRRGRETTVDDLSTVCKPYFQPFIFESKRGHHCHSRSLEPLIAEQCGIAGLDDSKILP